MPIYGFECPSCDHRFDRLQKLSDPDPTACPACGLEGIRRQVTAPAFRLAGSGWYETDFKKDGDKKRNLAGEGADGSGKGDAGKSDAPKTEAKSESKPEAAKADSKPAKTEPKPAAPASS